MIILLLTTIDVSINLLMYTQFTCYPGKLIAVIRDPCNVFCPICDDQIMDCFVKFCWVVLSRDAVITRLKLVEIKQHLHHLGILSPWYVIRRFDLVAL